MNGVVGRSGKKTPMAPRPRAARPKANQAARIGVIAIWKVVECPATANDLVVGTGSLVLADKRHGTCTVRGLANDAGLDLAYRNHESRFGKAL